MNILEGNENGHKIILNFYIYINNYITIINSLIKLEKIFGVLRVNYLL